MSNFNERTNTLLYKYIYISRFILDVSVVCERRVETGTDCYIDPTFSLDHSSTSSASWLWLLNWGSQMATVLSLQAGPPVTNYLNCCRHLPIFFHNAHLLPLLLPLIYTGASLDWRLGQGSIYNKRAKKLFQVITGYLLRQSVSAFNM